MLKLTYGQLLNNGFMRARMKLGNCARLKSPQVAYNVAKIHARFEEEEKLAQDLHVKIVDEFAEKDEAGNVKPNNGQPGTFYVDDTNKPKLEAFQAKVKEFHAIEFEIDRPRVDLNDIAAAELSPVEINALEPILTFNENPPLAEVKPLAKA